MFCFISSAASSRASFSRRPMTKPPSLTHSPPHESSLDSFYARTQVATRRNMMDMKARIEYGIRCSASRVCGPLTANGPT